MRMAAAPPPKHHPGWEGVATGPPLLPAPKRPASSWTHWMGGWEETGEGRMGGRAGEREKEADSKVCLCGPEGRGPGCPLLPSGRYRWISILAPQRRGENH